MKIRKVVSVLVLLCMTLYSFGQQQVELSSALEKQQIKAVNRTLSIIEESPGAVALDAAEGDGLGVLKEISCETGTIEVELLGENNPGRSFIGIAFNIQDGETFEAVYFRPFNFVATEQIRKDHMVQYIHHPEYTWYKLREERSGEFENEIPDPPDPDGWFKAIIKVSEKNVKVFVDDKSEAVLKVERLTLTSSDKIGLWVGNGSSGRFRNLVVHED
jgi:hypothetical protein